MAIASALHQLFCTPLYDEHLAGARREAYGRAVEAEAERQEMLVERIRPETFEMLDRSHEKAAEWLKEARRGDLRAQDVIQITRLYLEALKTFGLTEKPGEQSWSEEDHADSAETLKEIEAERDRENGNRGPDDETGGVFGTGLAAHAVLVVHTSPSPISATPFGPLT